MLVSRCSTVRCGHLCLCQQSCQGICPFLDSGTVTLAPLLNFIIRIVIKMNVLSDTLPVSLTTSDNKHVAIFRYQLRLKLL